MKRINGRPDNLMEVLTIYVGPDSILVLSMPDKLMQDMQLNSDEDLLQTSRNVGLSVDEFFRALIVEKNKKLSGANVIPFKKDIN